MSAGTRRGITLGLLLFVASVLQAATSGRIRIVGAQPDLPLTVALLGALFLEANGAASLGFFAGLARASLASPPHGGFGSIVVSTTLTAFGMGWLEERIFRESVLLAVPMVAAGTFVAEALFYIFDPQPHLTFWLRNVLGTSIYNAAVAVPTYLILRRLVGVERVHLSPQRRS